MLLWIVVTNKLTTDKMAKHKMSKTGFTLIELLIYIALVTIFISGAILFVWDVIYGREKAYQQQVVEQSARATMARIAYEIRRAQDINSLSSTSIELENGANDTTISLSSGVVQITTEGAGSYDLTSNQVTVTDLTFTDLSSSDEMTNDIAVSLTVRQAQAGVSEELTAQTTMIESVELNSLFKQARSLLIDASDAVLSDNREMIEGMTIQNTDSGDIVIDKLIVSWVGTEGGENVVEVQIGVGDIEWAGLEGTGSTLDLTDYTLTSAAGETDIDYIEFDSRMLDATFYLEFILSDGSSLKAFLSFGETPTVTPTPGVSTCSDYCQGEGYSSGICRQDAAVCTANGETHESGGDQYCTGGPSEDTCCCAP